MRLPTEPAVGRRPVQSVDRLAMAAVLALAFSLRLWLLGDKNLWWDEALALWAVRKPFVALTAWTAGDVHPPLFFWALWLWRRGVGETEFALRMLPALWGVVTVALAYALGRRAGGRRAGGLAALLLAVSPFSLWWSGELRMYALAGLWVALATYATQRWLAAVAGPQDRSTVRFVAVRSRRPAVLERSGTWLLVYLLAAVAILHSLYLGAAALVALNLPVGLAWLRRDLPSRRLTAWSAVQVAAVLSFLPWWRYASGRMQSWSSLRRPTGLWEVLRLDGTLLATGRSTALEAAAWSTALFWATVLFAAALAWRNRRAGLLRRPVVLVALTLLPPAAIWAATQPRSLFYSPGLEARYFYPFAAPVYALLAVLATGAAGGTAPRHAQRLTPRLLAAGLLLPLLGGLPSHVAPRRLRDDLQSLVLVLWSQARPDDALLLVSGDRYPLLEAAYGRWSPADGVAAPGGLPPIQPFPGKAAGPLPPDWERDLATLARAHPRIWLVEIERHWQDPDGKVGAWFAANRSPALTEEFGPHRLSLYMAPGAAPPAVERIDPGWPGCREAADDAAEVLACQAAIDVRPGDDLSLTLFARSATTRGLWPMRGLRLEALDPAAAGTAPVMRWPGETETAPMGATSTSDRRRFTLAVTERLPSGRYGFFAEGDDRPVGRPIQVGSLLPLPGPWPQGWQLSSLRFTPSSDDDGSRSEAIRLLGVTVTGPRLVPGATVAVDLRWDLPSPTLSRAAPTVFVHLLGPPRTDGGILWASGDGLPPGDRWPDAAGTLFDRHLLTLSADAPRGHYEIEVGLYDAVSGERWLVEGPGSDAAARRFVWEPTAWRRGNP